MTVILLTGATGFLGSHVADALVVRGASVRAVVRATSDTRRLRALGVGCVVAPLEDEAAIAGASSGCDQIIHCAALATDYGTAADFESCNVAGTASVLAAARRHRVRRVVHISTTDVYGYPDEPVNEECPMRPRGWPYGDSKIRAERLVWEANERHGVPVTIIRPCNIWGPRSRTFVLEITRLLRSGLMLHIDGGRHPAGLVYVANVVQAILLAADREDVVGEAFNVTDGTDTSWATYVAALADLLGTPRPRLSLSSRLAFPIARVMETIHRALALGGRPLLTPTAVALLSTRQDFCTRKAKQHLGFEPAVSFDEGMRRVGAWLQEFGEIEFLAESRAA